MNRRGSTLIEVMIAALVLILGMTGVVQLLTAGMKQFGRASGRAMGQDLAVAAIDQDLATPFTALALGVSDAGTVTLDGRRFGRIRTVTDIGDGGVRAYQIVVVSDWVEETSGPLALRTATATTIISEAPDAGP